MKISAVCDECRTLAPMQEADSGHFYDSLVMKGWLIGSTRVLCPNCNKGKR